MASSSSLRNSEGAREDSASGISTWSWRTPSDSGPSSSLPSLAGSPQGMGTPAWPPPLQLLLRHALALAGKCVLELLDDLLQGLLGVRRSAQTLAHARGVAGKAGIPLRDVVLHRQAPLQRFHGPFGALRQIERLVEIVRVQRAGQIGGAPLCHVERVLQAEVLGDPGVDLRDGLAGRFRFRLQLLRQLLAPLLLESVPRLRLHLPPQLRGPLLQLLFLRLQLPQLIGRLPQRPRLLS